MAFTETSSVQGMMAIAEKLHSRLLRVVKLTITSFVDNFINLLSNKGYKIGCYFLFEQVLDIGNRTQYKHIK